MNSEVNVWRVIGAVNVYFLMAVMGGFALEIIQITTGFYFGG